MRLNWINGYTCYKHMPQSQQDITLVPGYCCVDLGNQTHHGLAYVQIIGLSQPLYRFNVRGLVPWIGDDITGLMLKDYNKIESVRAKYSSKTIKAILTSDVNMPAGVDYIDLVRAFQPGWLWTKHVVAGQLGESIVNIPCKLHKMTKTELQPVIEYAVRQGWYTLDELQSGAEVWLDL